MITLTSCKLENKEIKDSESAKEMLISDSLKWSERMALSIMKRHPEAYQIDDKTEPKWDYVHGLVLSAFQGLYHKTQNQNYYNLPFTACVNIPLTS